MTHQTLAALLQAHKKEIAREAAKRVQTQKLPTYAQFTFHQLIKMFESTLEIMASYFETGNPTLWTDYIARISEERRQQGFGLEELKTGGNHTATVIQEVIEREYPGPENMVLRQRFLNRLNSMNTMTAMSATNTHLKMDRKP